MSQTQKISGARQETQGVKEEGCTICRASTDWVVGPAWRPSPGISITSPEPTGSSVGWLQFTDLEHMTPLTNGYFAKKVNSAKLSLREKKDVGAVCLQSHPYIESPSLPPLRCPHPVLPTLSLQISTNPRPDLAQLKEYSRPRSLSLWARLCYLKTHLFL